MRTPIVLLYTAFLAGCATPIPKPEPPAAVLLKSPAPPPDIKVGDDLVELHLKLRRSYITETGKLKRLQRYVQTMLGK
jgi:hypothetical protein